MRSTDHLIFEFQIRLQTHSLNYIDSTRIINRFTVYLLNIIFYIGTHIKHNLLFDSVQENMLNSDNGKKINLKIIVGWHKSTSSFQLFRKM